MTQDLKIDGRKARWFDCDWNNDSGVCNACEQCVCCKYRNFLEFAESVGKPENSHIEYRRDIEEYEKLKKLDEIRKANVSQSGFFTEQATKGARDFIVKMTGVKDIKMPQLQKECSTKKDIKKKP